MTTILQAIIFFSRGNNFPLEGYKKGNNFLSQALLERDFMSQQIFKCHTNIDGFLILNAPNLENIAPNRIIMPQDIISSAPTTKIMPRIFALPIFFFKMQSFSIFFSSQIVLDYFGNVLQQHYSVLVSSNAS